MDRHPAADARTQEPQEPTFGSLLVEYLLMPFDPTDGFNHVEPTTPERLAIAREQRDRSELALRLLDRRRREACARGH